MSPPRDTKRVPHLGTFRLVDWSVHQDDGTLCSEDRVVRLEPRMMDVLVYLAADPGAVVSKEELLEVVWGGSFVEEGALAQAIHGLRKALGDDARQPRFIQTIPKRGYRLVASVTLEGAGPELSVRSPPTEEGTAVVPSRWRAWLLLGIAVLAVAVILGLTRARLNRPQQVKETPVPPVLAFSGSDIRNYLRPGGRRIVVLPFENLNEPKDAYPFAEGLTVEITNDLASLHDSGFDVISRTTAKQCAHKTPPELARELKVDFVLEGTVQWAVSTEGRPRVRIRWQLVRATDDTQVWADGFDREKKDIREVKDLFAVESEISRQVIAQLDVFLAQEEGVSRGLQLPSSSLRIPLRAAPTENLDAYQAYLRGLELRDQPYYSKKEILKAVSMFERATALDPHFAAAWAELSQSQCDLAFNQDQPLTRIGVARIALERSIALEPGLESVWRARVQYAYRCENNDDAVLALLTTLHQPIPNDSEVLRTLGLVLRRKGQLQEALMFLRQAYRLNPKSAILAGEIAETNRAWARMRWRIVSAARRNRS